MKRVIKGAIAASLAVAAIFMSSGTANAYFLTRSFQTTWTRDSTWVCGSTNTAAGGVYYQACTRVVGGWWQSIVVVTSGGQGHWVAVHDYDDNFVNNYWYDLNSPSQADGAQCGYSWLAAGTSLTCWTPSIYQAHTEVAGRIAVSATTDGSTNGINNAPWTYDMSSAEQTGS